MDALSSCCVVRISEEAGFLPPPFETDSAEQNQCLASRQTIHFELASLGDGSAPLKKSTMAGEASS